MSGRSDKNNCSAFKPIESTKRAKAILNLINSQKAEIEKSKAKLKQANELLCELCEKCGENVCKNGEECDWKESEVTNNA